MNAIHRRTVGSLLQAVLVGLLAWAAGAAPVSVRQAVAAARGWLTLMEADPLGSRLGKELSLLASIEDGSGDVLCHVAFLERGGAVILAPDDAIEPVIAFTAKAETLWDPSPCNHLRLMIEADLADRVAAVKQGEVKDAGSKAGKWALLIATASDPMGVKAGLGSVSDVRVAPLVQTRWHQSIVYQGSTKLACYNYYTPPGAAGAVPNYLCGCVATALAQLMRYHRYPSQWVTRTRHDIDVDGWPTTRKLLGGRYDWGNMPDDPAGLARARRLTTLQRQAIGALCHDAGVASKMSYSASSSGAPLCWSEGTHPLQTTFLYASADSPWVVNYNTETFPKNELNMAINANLDAGLPGAISIRNNSGGHAVVVDGYGYAYGALYHHINMGWGGTDTAWYNLPNVNGNAGAYFRVSGLLFNLHPTFADCCVCSGRILTKSGQPLAGIKVAARHVGGVYKTKTTVSNAKGIYAFLLKPGTYTIAPVLPGFSFKPVTARVTVGATRARNVWNKTFKRVTRILQPSVAGLRFGQVPVGAFKTMKFSITNPGTAPVSIAAFHVPAGFSVVEPAPPVQIAPGARVVVRVRFAPVAAGFVSGVLTMDANQSSGSDTIAVKGTGIVE